MPGSFEVHGDAGKWIEVTIERHCGEKNFHIFIS
jgi:hypothetical protein